MIVSESMCDPRPFSYSQQGDARMMSTQLMTRSESGMIHQLGDGSDVVNHLKSSTDFQLLVKRFSPDIYREIVCVCVCVCV